LLCYFKIAHKLESFCSAEEFYLMMTIQHEKYRDASKEKIDFLLA